MDVWIRRSVGRTWGVNIVVHVRVAIHVLMVWRGWIVLIHCVVLVLVQILLIDVVT